MYTRTHTQWLYLVLHPDDTPVALDTISEAAEAYFRHQGGVTTSLSNALILCMKKFNRLACKIYVHKSCSRADYQQEIRLACSSYYCTREQSVVG